MGEMVQLLEIPEMVEMGKCVDGLDWLDCYVITLVVAMAILTM